ncbi:MAG: bifunctional folylpolyglutamate synthase/dihydrofolate synthase [Chloroflexi bacterium]|nr:bifunctional folylpolyglutamate synthase/dihydrofolate synthase [Chloroflexota bacterium]
MDYKAALNYILGFTNYEKSLKELYAPGKIDLERVRELLKRIGSPHEGPGIVHIAGTKGKGSTAAMIASVLRAAGYRTGLFTSPHLHTFRERMQIDGEMISPQDFALTLEEIRPHVEGINSSGEHGSLTTFEILMALALLYFARNKVDIEVMEVGVGGRLDATNVLRPDLCIITSISRDHTDLLGETLSQIAFEKAGIIKPGVPVVTAPQEAEVELVLEEICAKRGAPRVRVGSDVTWKQLDASTKGQRFTVHYKTEEYQLSIPLLGDHQLENAAVAVAAIEELRRRGWRIPDDSIYQGLRQMHWPGRLEVLGERPLMVVDGAHNGYSARKLRESLLKYFQFNKAVLIIGVSSDKNIEDIAMELLPMASSVIVTTSRHPRAAHPGDIVSAFSRPDIMVETSRGVKEALKRAYELAGPQDLICATGSLFIVGEVIESVKRVPAELY